MTDAGMLQPNAAARTSRRSWANRLAGAVVVATFILIVAGANVTSKGAGLSVPDWPTSFGSFNPQGWTAEPFSHGGAEIAGVRYEHGHRLIGAAVMLLVIALLIVLWVTRQPSWVRGLGAIALLAVIAQGIMGGLRVTEVSISLAVVHGIFAQAFLCLAIMLVAVTSPYWPRTTSSLGQQKDRQLRMWTGLGMAMAFVQLVLGVLLRQWHAAPSGVVTILHIAGALVLGLVVAQMAAPVLARPVADRLRRPMIGLMILYTVQVVLGLLTYLLLLRSPDRAWTPVQSQVPSAHVAVGALVLGTCFYLALRAWAVTPPASEGQRVVAGEPA